MKFISGAVTAALLCFATAVLANPGSEPEPMQRAFESVNENLSAQPSNKGLRRANKQIRQNRIRFDAKHGSQGQTDKVEHPIKVEQIDRVEKVERVERSERPERVERIDAQLVIDRPGNWDFGHSRRP